MNCVFVRSSVVFHYIFFQWFRHKTKIFEISFFRPALISVNFFVASLSLSATNEGTNVEKPDRKSVNEK